MSAVVNLTALAEARAMMTTGEYEVAIGAYCAPAPHEACGIAVSSTEETGAAWVVQSDAHDECSHPIRRDDAAGLVAEHNAMPVLLEVVRATLALDAAYNAWAAGKDAERDSTAYSAAYKAKIAALAKVSL